MEFPIGSCSTSLFEYHKRSAHNERTAREQRWSGATPRQRRTSVTSASDINPNDKEITHERKRK